MFRVTDLMNRDAIIMSVAGFLIGVVLARILSLQPEQAWSFHYLCIAALDLGYRYRGYRRAAAGGFRSNLKMRMLEGDYGGCVAWVIPLWAAALALWVAF